MNDFYRAYLDTVIPRNGTACYKWDTLKEHFGRDDLIAAWVADMDFRTVPAVMTALRERVENGIFGYTAGDEICRTAELAWLSRRHGFDCPRPWMLGCSGVVNGLYFGIRALTKPGDKVMLQAPVYPPFFSAIRDTGRELVVNHLRETESGWEMDFDDIEKQFSAGVRAMLLCSPHNPVGRVWTVEELTRLLTLAGRYGVLILSDEIHADFAFDRPHTCLCSLEGAERVVMLTAPTKSFNIPGFHHASLIAPDPAVREKLQAEMNACRVDGPELLTSIAVSAAFGQGDEWMDAVCEYIRENRDYAVAYIRERIPAIRVRPGEGTYLLWLDLSAVPGTHEEVFGRVINEARVALNDGVTFSGGDPEGEGKKHVRLNLATPRATLEQVLTRLADTFGKD